MIGFYMKCNAGLKQIKGVNQIQNMVKQIIHKPMVSSVSEKQITPIFPILENIFTPKKSNCNNLPNTIIKIAYTIH